MSMEYIKGRCFGTFLWSCFLVFASVLFLTGPYHLWFLWFARSTLLYYIFFGLFWFCLCVFMCVHSFVFVIICLILCLPFVWGLLFVFVLCVRVCLL